MTTMNDPLYSLLPRLMRHEDGDGTLQALMTVLETQYRGLQGGNGDGGSRGIADLYKELFIETCDAAVVARIASLVEEKGIPAGVTFANGRAFVANAIAFRRRKGTAAILPRLIYAATGWIAIVRDIGEPDTENAAVVDDKNDANNVAIDINTSKPTTSINNDILNVYVWRHNIDLVTKTLNRNQDGVYVSTNSAGFHNVPQPLPLAARPPLECLPVKVRKEWLLRDFKTYRDKWGGDGNGPSETIFYGDGRAFSLWAGGKLVHPSRIKMTLTNDGLEVTVSGDTPASLTLIHGAVSTPNTNSNDEDRLKDILKNFLPMGVAKKAAVIFMNSDDIAITQSPPPK